MSEKDDDDRERREKGATQQARPVRCLSLTTSYHTVRL
jgi:hypothetical protein